MRHVMIVVVVGLLLHWLAFIRCVVSAVSPFPRRYYHFVIIQNEILPRELAAEKTGAAAICQW